MNEKNVQEALGFLGDDLIEKGEFDMMQRKKHSRARRLPSRSWRSWDCLCSSLSALPLP